MRDAAPPHLAILHTSAPPIDTCSSQSTVAFAYLQFILQVVLHRATAARRVTPVLCPSLAVVFRHVRSGRQASSDRKRQCSMHTPPIHRFRRAANRDHCSFPTRTREHLRTARARYTSRAHALAARFGPSLPFHERHRYDLSEEHAPVGHLSSSLPGTSTTLLRSSRHVSVDYARLLESAYIPFGSRAIRGRAPAGQRLTAGGDA